MNLKAKLEIWDIQEKNMRKDKNLIDWKPSGEVTKKNYGVASSLASFYTVQCTDEVFLIYCTIV
jgi:hypothetical protein